jgi:hypothetical protein
MGSKISVFIIVIVMLVLAGMVTDVSSRDFQKGEQGSEHKTYNEEEEEKINDPKKSFTFENFLFEDEVYTGEIAEVDFGTNLLAVNYEDIIKRGVASVGVNFAGKYSVATWSCGDSCQNSAIINVETGGIVAYGIISAYGLSFSKESTLLIINPKENIPEPLEEDKLVEVDYYSIEKDELLFLAKETLGGGIIEDCIQVIANARNTITNEVVEFSTPCKIPFGWEIVE